MISCTNLEDAEDWVKPDVHRCHLKFDHSNMVNTVQRHTKCNSAYSLKIDSGGNQYCRFHYPFYTQSVSYTKYNKIETIAGVVIRPEIVAKRIDSRISRHQQIHLQGWRANCDISLVIDDNACVEYLANYAVKGEKISPVARDAFVTVVSNLRSDAPTKGAINH